MEAIRDIVTPPRPPDTRRWAICIALALGIHAAAASALLARWNTEPEQVANAPLIMIELDPVPVAPETKPTQAPPGPLQQQAAARPEPPKPVEKAVEPQMQQSEAPPQGILEHTAALPAEPKAELQLAVAPPEKSVEKPVEKKRHAKQASLASAPSPAEKKSARAAAPAAGAASHNPSALPNWKSELVARLERAKRYPPEAQAHGEQGVAQLTFSIDRSGGVHHARIARSSGSSRLDAATMALIGRAAPLPPPPPELSGTQIAISVPIRYDMR